MEEKQFKCFSRKLMYFLGVYDINYIDKFYDARTGRPYWTFEYTPELQSKLSAWEEFKKTNQFI